jgi:hypothetical protein
VELAPHALLNDHAANFAVKVAKYVVEIGAPRVGRDSSISALKFWCSEYGGAATIIGWARMGL